MESSARLCLHLSLWAPLSRIHAPATFAHPCAAEVGRSPGEGSLDALLLWYQRFVESLLPSANQR
jgi:hypothetical protein